MLTTRLMRQLLNKLASHHYITSRLASSFSKDKKSSTLVMEDYATITYVTAPTEDVARKLARGLVEGRHAACVNVVKSIESIYEWKGNIERDNEAMLVIKSHASKTRGLIEFVEGNHPYECPEVVSVKVDSGSKKYLDWIKETADKAKIDTEKCTKQ